MSLTVANSVITIVVPGVFGSPQQLQGYAADDVFGVEQITPVETSMGLDGRLSGGFVPVPVPQTFAMQADSPSVEIFDIWFQFQTQAFETFQANAFVTLPAVGKAWSCINGLLTRYSPIPDARRILQPRRFTVTWESVVPTPV